MSGLNSLNNNDSLLVWRDRLRRLATDHNDPVVMRSRPTTDIYAVHCWLINPNKVNLLSWLLAYLCNASIEHVNINVNKKYIQLHFP